MKILKIFPQILEVIMPEGCSSESSKQLSTDGTIICESLGFTMDFQRISFGFTRYSEFPRNTMQYNTILFFELKFCLHILVLGIQGKRDWQIISEKKLQK